MYTLLTDFGRETAFLENTSSFHCIRNMRPVQIHYLELYTLVNFLWNIEISGYASLKTLFQHNCNEFNVGVSSISARR